MDCIVIEGGKQLNGEVRVSGSKNAALCIMAATVLAPGYHTIAGLPMLRDITTMRRILEHLGALVNGTDQMCIQTETLTGVEAPYDLVRTMRASFLVLGPLLARFGRARVSLPGGCAIGVRPVDIHLKALAALGADIAIEQGYVVATCKKLRGTTILLDAPTVGGTENIMMAACLADGTTVIQNAAREPEIVELANALRMMGAEIQGDGTHTIVIHGVRELRPMNYTVMPDRVEAGTLMIAAGITAGDVIITNCPVHTLTATIEKLSEAGCSVEVGDSRVRVTRRGALHPVEITTAPYPGFPTDMQAQIMALLTLAEGTSLIRETIFENRFIHVAELDRMGARIKVERDLAIVMGVPYLTGARVMATDLRASASLILAGLAAQGTTVVSRVYHLDRGYDGLEKKLQHLGASIWRQKEPAQGLH
ncbi:MAG: UDP-N-acetylglucosamine 1-carboxyvinyltransferase [Desulfobacterota bacterium]|nr:UDP-N-acetylglucosamine 1-carboxyvinyltransferase [Thermodesulfobacteriota bacterium]